ncbi:hypothetical protein [Streptomyces sp. NPDC058304]|uniref:hypothetical protein n=1 Tax=Streptomyces sp. NPDC058304 TaxID=3346437 RepID=UPI0036ED5D40
MAHPTRCHYEVGGSWGGIALCRNHNGGSYRGIVLCKWPDGKVEDFEGGWRQYGKSYAYCQGDSQAMSAGVETSPYNKT